MTKADRDKRPLVNQEIDFMDGECVRCGCKDTELSTAHPCKFPEAIMKAINKHAKLPKELEHLLNKDENFVVLKEMVIGI